MKNLLLLAALSIVIAGCDQSSADTTALANTESGNTATNATNATDNGAANLTENASTDGASATNSGSLTDAQRDMADASQTTPTAPPVAASASGDVPANPKNGDEVAVMETAQGRIVLMFYPTKAPKHVDSFKKLAKKGFFDNTAFHRVIPGFMIQGGDPNSDPKRQAGPPGTGGPGYTVAAEPNDVKHVRGILSAARSQDRDSAGSQFFIMHAEYPSLDGEYDPYGRVVSGMEVVDKIVSLPTGANDMPSNLDQARVKSVRIVKWPVK